MSTSSKVRVLIADDSFFIRKYLSELLKEEEDVEVVGTAGSGDEVIELSRKLKPDVITMDYNMPGKNGLEATAAIMLGEKPLPAIIMLSAFSGEEGKQVWKTLHESGAHVIVKPSGEISLDIEKSAKAIVQKIKEVGFTEVRVRELFERLNHHKKETHVHTPTPAFVSGIVVVGASTGGPPLIEHLLTLLRPEDGIALVIIQHMSGYFTQLFAERLDRVTDFEVREMSSGDEPSPGVALVVPGGYRLLADVAEALRCEPVLESALELHQEGLINDAMKSMAQCYGSRVIGVLLSGMGGDGGEGLDAIKKYGGRTIVQDPETAPVSSMPEHAMESGFADEILPLEKMPEKINEYLRAFDAPKQ